jgi:hypothetical protein
MECSMSAIAKVATRGWSEEKFSGAVKRMAKRFGTQIKVSLIKKAYDDGLTVRSAYERCVVKSKPAAKKAA